MSDPNKPLEAKPSPPAAGVTPAEQPPVIPQVRMTLADALDKINVLETSNKAAADELVKVKNERDQANGVLDAQIRASFLQKVRNISNIPEVQLQKMTTHDLESLVQANEQLSHGRPKSIMLGNDDANTHDPGLIDLYTERLKRRQK